ncbi:MAG: D-alanyl-alanine synthetase, partial [Pseudomonadota bacterium]
SSRATQLQEQVETLLRRLRMAVIHGGDKTADGAVIFPSQNFRSWKSYEAVAKDIADSLERLGAQPVVLLPDDMRLPSRLLDLDINMAWLNTGGVQGVNSVGHAASILEMVGVPYVGHDPMTAAILDSKHVFKRQMLSAGVPTAEFVTFHGADGRFDPATNERFKVVFRDFTGPFIVKPVSGRASLHVEHVSHVSELATVANGVFEATHNNVMIERYLGGREYCVAICGPVIHENGVLQRRSTPFAFCCVERILEQSEPIFTSMDKKPITGDRIKLLDPVQDARIVADLLNLAVRVYDEMELTTLVRLDVRADDSGRLYVLETNPKPDLKAPAANGVVSIIAASLEQHGLTYDDLVYSLFADKVDVLMSKRRGSVRHLTDLITAS